MALRRLSVAHGYLRAAVSVRPVSSITKNENICGNEKPICPGNAFTLFLETQPRNGKSLKRHVYEAACKWNILPQEEKKEFQLKAEELEKRYQKEISEWEKRLQQNGHGDLVLRHHQLTDGKNLAIKKSRQALKGQRQVSMLAVEEEKESPLMEEESYIKETITNDSPVQRSQLVSSTKPFRNKKKQIIIVKSEESFAQ